MEIISLYPTPFSIVSRAPWQDLQLSYEWYTFILKYEYQAYLLQGF